jgi:hypothetical protein
LLELLSSGSAPARKLNRARIVLKADTGEHDAQGRELLDREIAPMLETSTATVQRVRERFWQSRLEAVLERSLPNRLYKRSLDGRASSSDRLLVCSQPPRGRERWSLRLLWRTRRSSLQSWRRSLTRPSARHSKKRTSSSSPQAVGDPAPAKRRFRVGHGRDCRPLGGTLRSHHFQWCAWR